MASLSEEVKKLSENLNKNKSYLGSEEATKNAIIMPFLRALGYDVFNPQEVVPEYTADVGIKKGEKVDYAIFKDGKLIMIIECKQLGVDLDKSYYIDQLYRYFSVTDASVAVLTNGEKYMFFSDTEKKNKMDQRPFMVFDMLAVQEAAISELERFSKDSFNVDYIVASAIDMKLVRDIKEVLRKDLLGQSNSFVSYIIPRVFPNKRRTPHLRDLFKRAIKIASKQLINDQVKGKLESMMTDSSDIIGVERMAAGQEAYIIRKRKREHRRKIVSFSFAENQYKVGTGRWADLLRVFCHAVIIERPKAFLETVVPEIPYFSTQKNAFRRPYNIPNTGVYVEMNLNAGIIEKLCHRTISLLGYKEGSFKIYFEGKEKS